MNIKTCYLIVLILTLPSCAVNTIIAPPSITQFQSEKTVPVESCTLVVKRSSLQNHFESRWNQLSPWSDPLQKIKEALINNGIAKNIVTLSSGPFRTQNDDDLRALAARMGCNQVFSYLEKQVPQGSLNILSLTYVTLVGMFLFPGSNYQLGVKWDVDLIDVATGAKKMEGKWFGLSELYHYRLGSHSLVSARAYQSATVQLVTNGIQSLKAPK